MNHGGGVLDLGGFVLHAERSRLGAPPPRAREPLLTLTEQAALAAAPWLADLPAEVREEILGHCRIRNLRAKECLHLAGEGPALCGVASGVLSIRLRRPHSDVLDYLPAGTWLVDAGRMAASRSLLMLEAHRRATVVSMPAELLTQLTQKHGCLHQPILETSWALMARLMSILEEFSALPLRQRVARCLMRLCDDFGVAEDDGIRMTLAINQTEMAQLVRASRQRLNGELKSMEAAGLLRIGRELRVTDLAGLQALASART